MAYAPVRQKDSARLSNSWMQTFSVCKKQKCNKASWIWSLMATNHIGTLPKKKDIPAQQYIHAISL